MRIKTVDLVSLVTGAFKSDDGESLADLFDLHLSNPGSSELFKGLPTDRGQRYLPDGERQTIMFRLSFLGPWNEAIVTLLDTLILMNDSVPDYEAIVASQHKVTNHVHQALSKKHHLNSLGLPVLYMVCEQLKFLAQKADSQRKDMGQKPIHLEQELRLLQKCFSLCLNDRSQFDLADTMKMGTYHMAVLLIKSYFKLNTTHLCKNVLNGIKANASILPPLNTFPKSDQVAYQYYLGALAFIREDYKDAEIQLQEALALCHRKAYRNRELILDYLIPIRMARGVMPSEEILKRSNRLGAIYSPLKTACITGNVKLYDDQVEAAKARLWERRTYLLVENGREVAVRTLMKRAWILAGKPDTNRVDISVFQKVYELGSGTKIDGYETECILANLIFKGLLKGYISHEAQKVVLGKCPFPWYPPTRPLDDMEQEARKDREMQWCQTKPALN